MNENDHTVAGGAGEGSALDPRLRGLLVCPSCRGELEERPTAETRSGEQAGTLRCVAEGLDFPVRDGVPWLVTELARKVDHRG